MNPKSIVTLSLAFVVITLGGVTAYSVFFTPKPTALVTTTSSLPISSKNSINTSSIATNTSSSSTSSTQSTSVSSSTVSSSSSSVAETNTLTKATVSNHDNSSDCWIILNKKVLDVTSYLPQHPGGASAIIPYCGSDATSAFNAIRKHGSFAKF